MRKELESSMYNNNDYSNTENETLKVNTKMRRHLEFVLKSRTPVDRRWMRQEKGTRNFLYAVVNFLAEWSSKSVYSQT